MNPASGEAPHLQIAARSDTGRSRTMNQDFAYAGPLPGAEEWDLLAVADGLGGHARGEWASQRTIELLANSLAVHLQTGDPGAAFTAAIEDANATVNFEARQQGTPGSATTLVAVLARDGQVWWANVGDSRLYVLAAGGLRQVSEDHSWVNDQVRAGILPADALRGHPNKNVVTKTVGFEPAVTPDTGGPLLLAPGDAVVLCSDGLHGPVTDAEIERAVASLDPGLAAERLIDLANAAGGPDNITVVIGRMGAPQPPVAATQITARPAAVTDENPARRRRWSLRRIIISLAGLAVLAAGAAGAWLSFS
jgi:protein phosphatase